MSYKVSVTAPVNIATLKYWGKRDKALNLPTNSSISITLSQNDLRTLTTVACSSSFPKDEFYLNGKQESLSAPRTQACLADLKSLRAELESQDPSLPKKSTFHLKIVSENNFPTAAGLASSAAGFAALVYAIATLYDLPQDASEISKIARKGSGSACRSLFGGYVAWQMGELNDGSDSKAVQVADVNHWPSMKALICVVSDDKKDVPSTSGMQSTVSTSDLFSHRVSETVPKRYTQMCEAIHNKDFQTFAKLTMLDSNSFHAVCLDSFPPIFYLNDTSKKIIKLVHQLNETENKFIVAYTFDAGPNAVLYYEQENEDKVLSALLPYFSQLPGFKKPQKEFKYDLGIAEIKGVSRIISTQVGSGPTVVNQHLIDDNGVALV